MFPQVKSKEQELTILFPQVQSNVRFGAKDLFPLIMALFVQFDGHPVVMSVVFDVSIVSLVSVVSRYDF